MKTIPTIILIVTFLSSILSNAQLMTPEQVVQQSLESYNDRNIAVFMSVMDSNVTFHSFSDGVISMKGEKACKEFYSSLFTNSPKLHSTILTRTVFGNKVIDHESIEGRNGKGEVIELVLIYEVKNEKIFKVTVIQKES